MKKIIYGALAGLLIIAGCRKEDNPKLPDLTRVPVPLITKDTSADQVISAANPASFSGKFTVDLFFKDDVKPQKFDIVVIKNGEKSVVKTIQADVTEFPTTVSITGEQLQTLFGSDIILGDNFDIGANVTTLNGEEFDAFPLYGNAYGSGVDNQPGASTSISYEASCQFEADQFSGDFEVVVDEWQDYAPGDIIPNAVEVGPGENQLTLHVYPNPAYGIVVGSGIVVDVDPNTNVATVDRQPYGEYDGSAYGTFYAEGSGSVNSCDVTIDLDIEHTVAAGTFGVYHLTIKKAL